MSRVARRTEVAGWLFVAPALLVIIVFFAIPALASLFLSLTDFDLYALADWRNIRFVGLDNFARLARNPEFWIALRNTFYFVLVGGPLSVGVSLGAALLLGARATRFRGLFRTVYFTPVVTTLVAVAVVWRYLYHPRYGLVDAVLVRLGLPAIDWLGDPRWAMPAIIILAVWKNFGYNMIIFLAGLQAIPAELYEAARMDGASAWQRFVSVTLPSLAPTLTFVSVVTMIGYFQLFAEPYVMTRGGPLLSTESLVLMMYAEGFRWWRLGTAAAIAVVLFVIIMAATVVLLRLRGRDQT